MPDNSITSFNAWYDAYGEAYELYAESVYGDYMAGQAISTIAQWLAKYEPKLAEIINAAISVHTAKEFIDLVRDALGGSGTVSGKIDDLLTSPNLGSRVEGVVAAWLEYKYGSDVVDVNREIRDAKGARLTEIDVLMKHAIVEVKSGETTNMNQLATLLNDPQANPKGLPVIIYMPAATQQQVRAIQQSGALYARTLFDIDNLLARR